MKFGRKYSLKVEIDGGKNVEIQLPFSCSFIVRRENLASSQTATFVIHNLGEQTRNLLYKDVYNTTEFRAVQFRAGYDDFMPLVFNGTISWAYSERRGGGQGFITTLECYDGGYAMANGFSNVTIGAGATFAEILETLSRDLPQMKAAPIIGSFPTKTARGSSYIGNTWNYIVQISSGLANIDNGQVKVLQPNEVLQAEIPVINSDTGLLDSPKRANQMIEFPLLFEPRLAVGQLVELDSQTNTIFNGPYKVAGFTHSGMISESVAGDARTEVNLWKGTEALKLVPGATVQ